MVTNSNFGSILTSVFNPLITNYCIKFVLKMLQMWHYSKNNYVPKKIILNPLNPTPPPPTPKKSTNNNKNYIKKRTKPNKNELTNYQQKPSSKRKIQICNPFNLLHKNNL